MPSQVLGKWQVFSLHKPTEALLSATTVKMAASIGPQTTPNFFELRVPN